MANHSCTNFSVRPKA